MNGVLGHFYALSRLNWAGDNLGLHEGGCDLHLECIILLPY